MTELFPETAQEWASNNPHDARPPKCLDCERSLYGLNRSWLCESCCPGDEAQALRADELREQRDAYNRNPRDGGPELWEDGWPELAAELGELEQRTLTVRP